MGKKTKERKMERKKKGDLHKIALLAVNEMK